MEWKFSADKERYGNIIGEVIHHTLFEDGTITKYDVKFGDKTIKNIPTNMLKVVKEQSHSHGATEDDELDEIDRESNAKADLIRAKAERERASPIFIFEQVMIKREKTIINKSLNFTAIVNLCIVFIG